MVQRPCFNIYFTLYFHGIWLFWFLVLRLTADIALQLSRWKIRYQRPEVMEDDGSTEAAHSKWSVFFAPFTLLAFSLKTFEGYWYWPLIRLIKNVFSASKFLALRFPCNFFYISSSRFKDEAPSRLGLSASHAVVVVRRRILMWWRY